MFGASERSDAVGGRVFDNLRKGGFSGPIYGINPKYSVPYDFDSSGLVNAHYAAPPEGLRVRNIRQRLYRGFCAFKDEISIQ